MEYFYKELNSGFHLYLDSDPIQWFEIAAKWFFFQIWTVDCEPLKVHCKNIKYEYEWMLLPVWVRCSSCRGVPVCVWRWGRWTWCERRPLNPWRLRRPTRASRTPAGWRIGQTRASRAKEGRATGSAKKRNIQSTKVQAPFENNIAGLLKWDWIWQINVKSTWSVSHFLVRLDM